MPDKLQIAPLLLAWYDNHARALPWRIPPTEVDKKTAADPYLVWLSEIMLQQTTVAAVKPFYREFIARWPDVEALAGASEAEVLAAWAGLGYYSRARNLYACARRIANDMGGEFPRSSAELKRLPGIGDYTAAAIAAICFGEQVTVVDANVERVVARLFAIDTPLPKARNAIRARAEEITPDQRGGDFAQAMMDLGAGLCKARSADCDACPLASECAAFRLGDPLRFPVKLAKRARPQRKGSALWITRGNSVLLIQRPGDGMLGGMMALPEDDWRAARDGQALDMIAHKAYAIGTISHIFTHFSLELDLYALDGDSAVGSEIARTLIAQASEAGRAYRWQAVTDIGGAGLPTLYIKAAELAQANLEKQSLSPR